MKERESLGRLIKYMEIINDDIKFYNDFLQFDNELKKIAFNQYDDKQIYKLFVCQEKNRNNKLSTYKNKAEHYDYINETNASIFLKIVNDHIEINWPNYLGFSIETIKSLDDLTAPEIFISRILYEDEDNIEYEKLIDSTEFKKHIRVLKNIGNCICINKCEDNNDKDAYYLLKPAKGDDNYKYDLINELSGYWPSNSMRAIPKITKETHILCGKFKLNKYKDLINIISSPVVDKYTKFMNAKKICNVYNDVYFNYLCEAYQQWFSIKKEYPFNLEPLCNSKYGYYGKAAPFGDLKGGAWQMNTIFDYETIKYLGFIEELEFFIRGNEILIR